jgi:hypothetical protein
MTIIRTVTWVLVLIAATLAGPNLPAQGLSALREAIGTLTRRAFFRS